MLDAHGTNDNSSDRPSWDDIEATLQVNIDRYTEDCSSAATHNGSIFISNNTDIKGIFAQAGNEIMQQVIKSIIQELNTIDDQDICFGRFIVRLKRIALIYRDTKNK